MNGLKTTTSDFSVPETVNRMVAQIEEEGWHLFARIDHAKEARDKGLELRPSELILFGNPEVGTKLMQDLQISAIDLPMKALAWEDVKGQVNIACNDIEWLKERHGLTDDEAIGLFTPESSGFTRPVCQGTGRRSKNGDGKVLAYLEYDIFYFNEVHDQIS